MQRVAEPAHVLLRQRQVVAVGVVELRDRLRGSARTEDGARRTTRQEVQQREDDGADE